ncbi:MAG TPA: FapA family protein [Bacilli bacterium]
MANDQMQVPIEHFINVVLSDDKINAYLHFNNPPENFQCTLAQLDDLLRKNRVTYGIQYDVLADMVKDPKKYIYTQVCVAIGDAPRNGKDGYVRYLFNNDGITRKPLVLEDGTVDYKEVASLNNVRKGQLIAEKAPPEEGTHGKAVTGELIYAKAGKEARFKLGKNVVTDAEQKGIYAAIDGLVTMTDRDKINVFPVYEVNGDVDYNIGNIDFVGNVVVRGNVLNGFKIKADGDIRVIGGVEGAELFAGGNIEITAGVLGRGKGYIKAGKNVKISFVQEGNIEAKEDVIVTQSIMHSLVRAGRNVICKGNKGLIVGGTIQAGEKVTARTIGNNMSTVTSIEVGVLPELRNELADLRGTVKELAENLDKTNKALALLDQLALAGQLSEDKKALRTRLSNTKRQQLDELQNCKDRMLEIEKSLEDTSKAIVEVGSTIYGGARVTIGRYTRYVKDATMRVTFKMVDGEIVMQS